MTFDFNHISTKKFIRQVKHPILFPLFSFWRVPGAWFFRLRVKEITATKAVVSIPYAWRTKNPFRSIYFVAQAAAAEMSTALLMRMYLNQHQNISTLVLDIKAEFVKKANTKTRFSCHDGDKMLATIEKVIQSDEAHTCTMYAEGTNTEGQVVSKFWVTWSMKKRSGKK